MVVLAAGRTPRPARCVGRDVYLRGGAPSRPPKFLPVSLRRTRRQLRDIWCARGRCHAPARGMEILLPGITESALSFVSRTHSSEERRGFAVARLPRIRGGSRQSTRTGRRGSGGKSGIAATSSSALHHVAGQGRCLLAGLVAGGRKMGRAPLG